MEIKDFLIYWWNSNKILASEEETKIFLEYLNQYGEKMFQLVLQGSMCGDGKEYILSAIRQGYLDYLLDGLPEITQDNSDYHLLRQNFMENVLNPSQTRENHQPINVDDMDWNQIIADIKDINKERKK